MNIEEMRLMKTKEEVRNRAKELLQMPKEEILTKYMFQEQEIERLNNIINEMEKFLKINSEKDDYDLTEYNKGVNNAYSYTLDKLKELKEKENE